MMPSSAAVTNAPRIDASPPTRDHDQHVDQIFEREIGIEADDLDAKRAAQSGEPAAERKGDGEYRIDVEAEPARHALIVDARAHRAPKRV